MTPGLAHASQIAQPDMTELLSAIEYLPTDDLPALGRKSRTHSHQQIEQIAESIRTFGFINPILIDENGKVIAGNARVDAARKLVRVEVQDIQPAEEAASSRSISRSPVRR